MALGTRRAPLSPGRLARCASQPESQGRDGAPAAVVYAHCRRPRPSPSLEHSVKVVVGAAASRVQPMLATVDAYNISLFLHISAVVIGFGSTYAEAVMFPLAMAVDKRHLPYVHRLGMAINQRLATPALVVILATGIYQVAEDKGDTISFGDAWVSASFLILIVLGGMIGGYFVPTDRRLAEMAERDLAS